MSPRRPGWWPARLWPGGSEPAGREEPASAEPGGPGETASGTDGTVPGRGEGIQTFLALVVSSLQAGRATLWRLEDGGGEWRLVGQSSGSGWPDPEVRERRARGHAFTWALREELVLQVPAERLREPEGRDGWAVLVPVDGAPLLLCVWFSAAPSATVRRAVPEVQEHLRWVSRAEAGLSGAGGAAGETFGASRG